MSEPDTSILDELDKRQRRARILSTRTLTPKSKPKTRVDRTHKPSRRPLYGPPEPQGFKSKTTQAKAAAARKGLRNAAYSADDNDAMCEGVKEILLTLRGGPQPSDETIKAFTNWVNNNNGGTNHE